MNSEEDNYTRIEAYLNHTMSASERAAFEKAMSENPELAEDVEINRQMQLHYGENSWSFARKNKDHPDVKALEAYFRSDEAGKITTGIKNAETRYEKHRLRMRRKKFFYYAAASVMLFFFAGNFFMKPPTTDHLYADHKNWEELTSLTVRGDNTNNTLAEGEQFFNQQKYTEAIAVFNTYLEENPTSFNSQVLIYLGGAYLESGQYENALRVFDRLLNSNMADSPKAYWYKALTYLKKGDKEKVKEQLETILSDPENPDINKAKKLKRSLSGNVLYRIFGLSVYS